MRAPGNRHGGAATASLAGAPLPQEYAVVESAPVRIVHGFTQFLPGRAVTFFNRVYFAAMPKPIMVAPGNSFPRGVPVMRIQAPQRQCIVLRNAAFKVYEHSGIGVDDIIETPPSRTTTYFGFSLRIGNRGLTDFDTNNNGTLNPSPTQPVNTGNNNLSAGLNAGAGNIYPYSGPITPPADENFAAYVRPGDEMVAQAFVLRLPNFDARLFSFEMTGWLAPEVVLDTILNKK